jgi:hypothetical protein
VRQSDKPINLKFAQDTTLNFGEMLPGGSLNLFKSLLQNVWTPVLRESDDWGKVKDAKDRAEFLEQAEEFVSALDKQIGHLKGEVELKLPQFNFEPYELKPNIYQKLAGHREVASECSALVKQWNDQIQGYLKAQVVENLAELQADQGPKIEIEYWGRRYVEIHLNSDACFAISRILSLFIFFLIDFCSQYADPAIHL